MSNDCGRSSGRRFCLGSEVIRHPLRPHEGNDTFVSVSSGHLCSPLPEVGIIGPDRSIPRQTTPACFGIRARQSDDFRFWCILCTSESCAKFGCTGQQSTPSSRERRDSQRRRLGSYKTGADRNDFGTLMMPEAADGDTGHTERRSRR